MGSALEIGIKIRKVLVISIRACYRSVCNHPFLVGFLGFLILLYRSFPFLFSVLVSASPVLVCTAVLLGTLLSFGQPNVPEVEKDEKVTHGVSSLQTGFSEGATVVADRDESYFVKGYSENRSATEEWGIEEASLAGDKDKRVKEDGGLLSDVSLDNDSQNIQQPENHVKEEVERKFHSFEYGKGVVVQEEKLRSEGVSSDEEAIEKHYVLVQKVNDDILDTDNEKTPLDPNDTFKGDHLDFSPSSSWKKVENNDDEENSLESGSDQAESSSPDASMADIMPMLDELHPLLDQDAPQPAHLSHDGSDGASEKSQKSNDDHVESDENAEKCCEVEEEDGVDEHEDEEEEEMEGGKEDESKSAIKWTEDDQKNLMDLGTLELERNQRLENLIARRRARRLMFEKNLIDLDSADIPYNVAPIATTRRNPFDFPDEYDVAMGLPPIPGSAPSILQPRQNPFDIPYDSNEEKPDLKGDSFQQEFTVFNQKDTFFRRHESFSLGPSVLGINKHERQDINWKPIFISERMASEGTSYSSFQRQSSEVSDSKLSSVPDTESVSSIDQDERKFSEQDLSQETELVYNVDHVSDCVERGSQSSGEIDSVEMIQAEESNLRHDEVEIVLGGLENPSEMELYSGTGEEEIHEQFNVGETHLRREPIDEESSSRSSRSSLSEVIDNIPDEKMEKSENLQHQGDGYLQESGISMQASVEELNFQHVSGEVEDNQRIEPVYDSSPPAAGKLQSLSSVSSDSTTEFSKRALPPASVEMTANVADKEIKVLYQIPEDNTSGHEETQGASSQLQMEVKNELRSQNSQDINQHNVSAVELSAVAPNFVDQNGSIVPNFLAVPASVDFSMSSDIGSVKGVTNSGFVDGQDQADHSHTDSEILHQDNLDSPASNCHPASENSHSPDNESMEDGAAQNEVTRFYNANISEAVQDEDEMLDLVASGAHHMSSSDLSMPSAQDLQPSLVAGQAPLINPNLPSEETENVEKNSLNEEDIFQVEQANFFPSSTLEQGITVIYQDLDKNMVSSSSDGQYETDVKCTSYTENNPSSSDKLVVAPSSSNHDESQVESTRRAGASNDGVEEMHNAMDKIPQNISSVTFDASETPEFRSPTGKVDFAVDRHGEVENEDQKESPEHLGPSAEGYTSQVTAENIKEQDEIKEIDEAFLSELDKVGDFSVGDVGVSLHADLVHEKTRDDAEVSPLPKDAKIAAEVEEDIPVLEARSLEDINLAFKQIQEGVDVKEVILPSTIKDQLVNEESKDQLEVISDFQVVEARSLDDINIALKQISDGNQGQLPKPLDLKDRSVKAEENEVGSTKVIEFFDVASIAEETRITPVDKLENVHVSSSSNEAKSHSRRSSSSSSSSDSD